MARDIDEILNKYSRNISRQIDFEESFGDISREYITFKNEMVPRLSKFEKFVKAFSFFEIKLSSKDYKKINDNLKTAHLELTPGQVASAAFFGFLISFIIMVLIFVGIFFYQNEFSIQNGIFLGLGFFASIFVFYYIYSSPSRLANIWRLKASSQMVPCILYIVVYMKHTSNLERAIVFASKHLKPPLSLDLKKIFWDVETGKFTNVRESLDNYLKIWEKDALEFVEAFHLIESSLYEPSESRRIATLEKSLQVILDGVYEKMLIFSREVRAPLTNLYMLGIVLPTLGLALLPLASTLLGGVIKSYHVFILFNLIIPFFVFYLTTNIMLKRPGGYGETELLELNPDYYKYKSNKSYLNAFIICFPVLILGLLPFILQINFVSDILGLSKNADGFVDFSLSLSNIEFLKSLSFFDFKLKPHQSADSSIVGPFGIGALILSLFIPLSVALFFSIVYISKTKELIKSREDTRQLEREFSNSLFQLGNRLGDGIPAEIAFSKVAESTKGQKTENFFKKVSINIRQLGLPLESAIFDPHRGAIVFFPSELISTSMRILIESSKKGLKIAAESLMSISEYIKNIKKVEERMKDLLAEVVSDMKSNMTFLAPLLSGIVIGLSGMIAFILNKLSTIFSEIQATESVGISGFSNLGAIIDLFNIVDMVPPYYLQVAIGIYMIQVIFIITNVLVTINSGEDKLKKTNDIGKNLIKGMGIYFIITLFSIIVLSLLAAISLSGISQ
ncbi:MAG: hypothetical protein QW727_00640 [Candidatus Pacearchaeota archaeon]